MSIHLCLPLILGSDGIPSELGLGWMQMTTIYTRDHLGEDKLQLIEVLRS